jgi:hypothetical protein
MSKILLFIVLLSWVACKNAPKSEQNSDTVLQMDTAMGMPSSTQNSEDNRPVPPPSVLPKTDKPIQNFTIVPKKQIGLITSNMSEADIKKVYGEVNVSRIDRGDVQTLLYPNTPNELEISWKKGFDFKKLETAIIRKGNWKTTEGIGIGTTIDNLNTINGKSIELYTIEDGFAMVRWKGGAINPNLKVVVDTDAKKVVEMQIDF